MWHVYVRSTSAEANVARGVRNLLIPVSIVELSTAARIYVALKGLGKDIETKTVVQEGTRFVHKIILVVW